MTMSCTWAGQSTDQTTLDISTVGGSGWGRFVA